MSEFTVYALVSAVIFGLTLHGLIVRAHLLVKVIALNMMGSSVFLFLVAVAARNADAQPDPVPQAMVLTGIVVAVSATALGLALIRRLHADGGHERLPDNNADGQ
jgi:multicomponent Na+:H+ antiporter subunit C